MEEPKTELVTPKKAEFYLNRNQINRKLYDGRAEQYATDMANGKWTRCVTPISFYVDGNIADGQHRLWAIVMTGISQRFIIVTGLTRADGLNIDTGLTRSVVDAARIAGVEHAVNNTLLTAARGICEGAAPTGTKSNAAKLTMLDTYRAPAEFASSNVKRAKFIGVSPILAAVGRAFMHEADKERLKRFCHVLGTGFMDDNNESAAIALRNYMLMKGQTSSLSGNWVDTFIKAQHAIYTFMRGRALQAIKKINEEHYPLVAVDHKPMKGHKGTMHAKTKAAKDKQ